MLNHLLRNTRRNGLFLGLLALITLLFMTIRGAQAVPFDPLALNQPENIGCVPHQGQPDQVRVQWDDTNDGNADYNVYRKNVNDNSWGDPIATVTDPNWNWVDTAASTTTVYHYRVTAFDDNEETSLGSAPLCREPLLLDWDPDGNPDTDDANYRMYYRLVECPPINGKPACTPNDLVDGQNKHVTDALRNSEDYRSVIMGYGFNDPAIWKGEKPFPIDFFPCNNGCANGDGITYRPDWFESGEYDPNTGTGSDYEYFVVGHEIFHKTQGAHGGGGADPYYKWVIEGQARATEDKFCVFNNSQCETWDEVAQKWYRGQVDSYLGSPEKSLLEASYNAALFWIYMMEQFGTIQDDLDYGVDVMVSYWEQNEENYANNVEKDGIGTINDMLAQKFTTDRRFQDIFADFAVANYVKDLVTAPVPAGFEKYNYLDEEECGTCTYDPVKRTISQPLLINQPIFGESSIDGWGARYYEVDPDSSISVINVEVEVLGGAKPAYYHVLAIDNGQVVNQWSGEGDEYDLSIPNINPAYDRIALIVVAYDQAINVRYGFNLTDGLYINSPNALFPALVGESSEPKKFIAELEVIDHNLEPIPGIDPSDFTISVGSTVINPPANPGDEPIVASTYIAGKYWLVIRAPSSPGCTTCDLTISYGEYEDIEADAIEYGPVPDVDNMLIIDRSGSMEGAKIGAAQEAAKLYVDSYNVGDRIGVISFNESQTEEYGLATWNDINRQLAQQAIDTMDPPVGATAVGAALRAGQDALIGQTDPNEGWALVLLSDGKDTVQDTADHIPQFLEEYKDRVDDGDDVPIIHVVAIGDDADGIALEEVATTAGGTFQFLPEVSGSRNGLGVAQTAETFALALSEIYRLFAESILTEQQVFSEIVDASASGRALRQQQITEEIVIENGVSQAVFVLKTTPDNSVFPFDVFLEDPSGTDIPPTIMEDDHFIWRVPAPQAGTWEMGLCVSCDGFFLVEASVISDLTLQGFLGLPLEERLAGKQMPLLVALSDIDPITGASVVATVPRTGETLTLFDDGQHGDGAANDGFYGGIIANTFNAGGYSVEIEVSGTSDFAGPFTRRAQLSFYMQDGKDGDEDRLPDWWEGQFDCLDTSLFDSTLDQDGDELVTAQEYFRHTDPCDPDTDNGGEADGSEVNRQADPLNPTDDFDQPPRLKAWPAAGKVMLRISVPELFRTGRPNVAIYRSTGGVDGPFELLVADLTEGTYEDLKVQNGTTYCYYAVTQSRGTSGPSGISCATPQADPYPPHGEVVLPPGVVQPVRPTTLVWLEAYDDPETEEHPAFDGALLFPAEESGLAEMQLSSRSDFEGAVWEPYAPFKEWTFEPRDDGEATVFVRFRDNAGNLSEVSALAVSVDMTVDPDPTSIYLPWVQRE